MILVPKPGMSLVALLVTLSLFSGIFLSISYWTADQRKSAVRIYQEFQALQIADNQRQRLFLGEGCQPLLRQNELEFRVYCEAGRIRVEYGGGEIVLEPAE